MVESCFSNVAPINPVNSLILATYGDNFFPPYSTEFQPQSKTEMTEENLLQIVFPGGGKVRPVGANSHNEIASYITPITGALGSIFSFFAPLFIILDVIRAIIDMICSLFNPVPLIATVVDFFITVVPPLIALYPPLSSLLHALNTAKVVSAIAVSMIAGITPTIDLIVKNALEINGLLAEGNFAAIDSVNLKICTLLQRFDNQLGAFAPIQFIIEILNLFLNLSSKFFCVQDSACCDSENCPPILVNAPTGVARVTRTLRKFTLKDLVDSLFTEIFDKINPILDIISNFINVVLNDIFGTIENKVNEVIDIALEPIQTAINSIFDTVLGLMNVANTVLGGIFTVLIDSIGDSLNFNIPNINLALPDVNFDFELSTPDSFEDIVFVKEEMDLGLFKTISSVAYGNSPLLKDPTAGENPNGRTSDKGIGEPYSQQELSKLLKFLVEPEKIPASQIEDDPATLRIKMKRILKADGTADNTEVVRTLTFANPDLIKSLSSIFIQRTITSLDTITIRSEDFDEGDIIEYSIVPDQIALLSLNLIGLGCQDDIANSANGVFELVNADVDASTVTGGGATSGFDSGADKIGEEFPPPPLDDLQECFANQVADPTVSQVECVSGILQGYLDDLGDFYDNTLCVAASRVSSNFSVNKNFAIADGKDSIQVELTINDLGGNNLLVGRLPTSTSDVQFFSTLGNIGPILFDPSSSSFKAHVSSEVVGKGELTAAFLVNGEICMIPGEFDGFVVTDKVIDIEFIPEGGLYPRRRRDRVYRQSSGGRRR